MRYNINSGYGLHSVQSLHNVKPTLGKVFLVGDSSTVDLSRVEELFKLDPDGELRKFADLETALNSGSIVANRGDVVLIAPNHAETIDSAGAIALDIADVSIIGLGSGEDKPEFRWTTAATATITASANDVSIENVRLTAAFADVATLFDLTTAKNFTLSNCEIFEEATNENFVVVVRTSTADNASDGLTVQNCTIIGADAANDNVLQLRGDIDRLVFANNYVNLNVADGEAIIECATGKDITNVQVLGNKINRLNTSGDLLINNDTTANSGIVADNYFLHADTAGEVFSDADGVGYFNNYATAVVTASGYILPAVDS